jgi:CRISPR/Cas system-associated endoribonuclease Cas2
LGFEQYLICKKDCQVKKYLLCYDIADKKRLYKVRKYAYPFSLGGQKSALYMLLSKKEVKALLRDLSNIIDKSVDKINLIEVYSEPIFLGIKPDIVFENGAIIV